MAKFFQNIIESVTTDESFSTENFSDQTQIIPFNYLYLIKTSHLLLIRFLSNYN